MTIMSIVTAANASRVAANFTPFNPLPLDLYLSIRTFCSQTPIVHCLYISHPRVSGELVFEPGLYVYTFDRRIGVELLWFYGDTSIDELDSLISHINCKEVFDSDVMNALGFVEKSFTYETA